MALFAKNIDEPQKLTKQIHSMLASSDNQLKQFKVNCLKHDSSPGGRFEKKARTMPPWMDDKPYRCRQNQTTMGQSHVVLLVLHQNRFPQTNPNSTTINQRHVVMIKLL
jgi:hypothetical protein